MMREGSGSVCVVIIDTDVQYTDVHPLHKVNRNAFIHKRTYDRVHVSPAAMFVHLQQ